MEYDNLLNSLYVKCMDCLRNIKPITLSEYLTYIRTNEFIASNSKLSKTTFTKFKNVNIENELELAKKELACFELIKSVMKREKLDENDLYYLSPNLGRSLFAISMLKEIGVSSYYLKQIIKECLQFVNWNLEIEDILTHFLPLFVNKSDIESITKNYINTNRPDINDKTINFHIGKIKKLFEIDIDPALIKTYL